MSPVHKNAVTLIYNASFCRRKPSGNRRCILWTYALVSVHNPHPSSRYAHIRAFYQPFFLYCHIGKHKKRTGNDYLYHSSRCTVRLSHRRKDKCRFYFQKRILLHYWKYNHATGKQFKSNVHLRLCSPYYSQGFHPACENNRLNLCSIYYINPIYAIYLLQSKYSKAFQY